MMRKRGSFKATPGVKLNWTRRSGPTRAEALAQVWRMRPGIHYVRIHALPGNSWDIVVNGNELTFDRVKRILDAGGHHDSATMARALKTFIHRWNLINDDGKPIPVTQKVLRPPVSNLFSQSLSKWLPRLISPRRNGVGR